MTNNPATNLALLQNVTLDVLQMYRIPLACVKQHAMYAQIGSTEIEVNTALAMADNFISIKMSNPNAPGSMEDFEVIKTVAFKAIMKQICL